MTNESKETNKSHKLDGCNNSFITNVLLYHFRNTAVCILAGHGSFVSIPLLAIQLFLLLIIMEQCMHSFV